jgi:hypothetical protein
MGFTLPDYFQQKLSPQLLIESVGSQRCRLSDWGRNRVLCSNAIQHSPALLNVIKRNNMRALHCFSKELASTEVMHYGRCGTKLGDGVCVCFLSLLKLRHHVPMLINTGNMAKEAILQISYWYSSGSIVSDYGLDDRAIGVRSPAGAKDFSSSLYIQTGSGAHPASCTIVTGGKARPGRDADHSPPSTAEVVNE